MRVLAVTPLYPPGSLVGSWISTHECLAHLAARGHQVDVIAYLARRTPKTSVIDGVTVRTKTREMTQLFKAADVVISHLGDNEVATRLARCPLVRMVHSGHDPARLRGAALAVFNSQHLQRAVGWDGPSIVVPPPIHPERYRTAPGDHITLVNLSEAKGGRLFWRLADALADRRFLGVRGGYGAQVVRERPNVEVVDTTPDMRGVYGRTRLLLMPSDRESYGRVALEAACSGIPTVAHPTEGVLETMGDAATYADRGDLAAWVAAINTTLDDWDAASARALARAAAIDPVPDLGRFADAIEGLA